MQVTTSKSLSQELFDKQIINGFSERQIEEKKSPNQIIEALKDHFKIYFITAKPTSPPHSSPPSRDCGYAVFLSPDPISYY